MCLLASEGTSTWIGRLPAHGYGAHGYDAGLEWGKIMSTHVAPRDCV